MKYIKSLTSALATSLALTGPALALSCMPYGVTNAWHDASNDPADYLVVHGVMTFDPAQLPKVDMRNQSATPPETLVAAHLKGKALTTQGFAAPFDQDITLTIQCFGPWCPGAKSGADYLAFVKKDNGKLVLTVNPCGGFAFGAPQPAMLEQVISCQKGGKCEKESLEKREKK